MYSHYNSSFYGDQPSNEYNATYNFNSSFYGDQTSNECNETYHFNSSFHNGQSSSEYNETYYPPSSEMDGHIDGMINNWVMAVPQAQYGHMQFLAKVTRRHSTTVPKPKNKRRVVNRKREEGAKQLWIDYFAPSPERTYDDGLFRRRFRMNKELFLRIVNDVTTHEDWLKQKEDAIGKRGLSELQKCTAAMRILAYGVAYDQLDEYIRMGVTTAKDCLYHFVDAVIAVYGATYLRAPNPTELERLLKAGSDRGFPGMLGSIDCMHWEWKNCPMEWEGQFTGRDGKSTIVLEAVASYDLWIWHAFFGVPSSCNDINVLDRSPLFNDVLEGRAPNVHFQVNGHEYDMGYYLTDGIFPQWSSFIPSIRIPRGAKAKLFSQVQESCRKDVERAFGVLQARFHIIRDPSLVWDINLVRKIMITCVILHNMIVENERGSYKTYYDPAQFEAASGSEAWQLILGRRAELSEYLQKRFKIRDKILFQQLKQDLVENVWTKFRG